ncbi:unnamed protein product, partial [Symbiodinium necroappetens]
MSGKQAKKVAGGEFVLRIGPHGHCGGLLQENCKYREVSNAEAGDEIKTLSPQNPGTPQAGKIEEL